MRKLPIITPGEILLEEFLKPLRLSAYKLSKETDIPETRVSQILKNKRRITVDTALRLGAYFGVTAQFWLNLQNWHDVQVQERALEKELDLIKRSTSVKVLYKKKLVKKYIKQKSAR